MIDAFSVLQGKKMGTSFNVFKVLIFFKSKSELATLFVSNPKEDVSENTSKN